MMRLVVSAMIAACVAGSAGGQAVISSPSAREPDIAATGRGESHLAPTFAVVMITVSTRDRSATQAASQTAAKVASTLSSVRSAGVAAEDLSNEGYNVELAYDEKGRRDGFTARNSIRARINSVDQVGRIIDAALAGGATEIASVQFGAARIEDARRGAMSEAVRQARTDAEIIASAAGGRLGRLISLSAGSGMPPGFGTYAVLTSSAVGPAPTVLSPRDLTVSAQASGRWEFIPGTSVPARDR
jgi:uncharacterized protein YggE